MIAGQDWDGKGKKVKSAKVRKCESAKVLRTDSGALMVEW
jgi:hypothetical protein